MIWYKMRKDKLMSEENVHYISYGISVYSGLRRIKVIKDISLNKDQLARQIRMWNYYKIRLNHLEEVIEDFVDAEGSGKKIEEKPYSLV